MKTTLRFLFFGSALALTACGSIKTKDRNVELTGQVRRAAVVGFMADLPARSGISLSGNSGEVSGKAGGSMITKESPQTDSMLKEISKAFGQRLKWSMLDTAKLPENPSYQEAYKKTMEGFQNKFPPGAGSNRFMVAKFMDFDSLRILPQADREKLMRDLKVDAVIATKVDVVLNGTTVMGVGNRYPQSKVFFQVFKMGQANPIWFETLDGKEMEESIGKTGLTLDEEKAANLALISLKDGLSKLQ
ncbi:MAG: hypothetical protein KF681_15755 [Bdellovibrionaceae bacterium]|nr:hypothetical protein [Pseudobdellovibrionaceae bacterium]